MNCPNCIERMSSTNANGIQTQTCLHCNGVWVSEKALAILLKQEASSLNTRSLISGCDGESSAKRMCALCPDQKLKIIHISGVEIDACETCGGIFFDEDEIKAILPNVHKPQSGTAGKIVATEGLAWVIMLLFSGFG